MLFKVFKEKIESIKKGVDLEKFTYDEDWIVRLQVAKYGQFLDVLYKDLYWAVRAEVAQQGAFHNILYKDENWFVRATVAQHGNFHNILYKDPDWRVRKAVAKKGGFLYVLKDDENPCVKSIAQRLINSKLYTIEKNFGTYEGELLLFVYKNRDKYEIESGCYTTDSLDKWREKCKEQLDLETADKYYKIIKEIVEAAN